MTYSSDRREACQELFANFEPDLSGSKAPETVLIVARLAAEGLFSHEIAERVGKTPKAVQKMFRRYNFPVLQNYAPPRQEQRIGWKGGEKMSKGYLYRRMPDHPNGTKYGSYVAVHRLVAEEMLGRYLLSGEVVDHIDGNTLNNAPSNLRVFGSNAEHLKSTLSGKCPEWTEEGKARLQRARSQPRRMWKGQPRLPSHEKSETGVDR